MDAFVTRGAGLGLADPLAVADDEVGAHDDADVVYLEALAGVDAADLLNGGGADDPEHAVLGEVPLFGEVVFGEDDVVCFSIRFGVPGPAVAGYHSGAVAVGVFEFDALVEFVG